MGALQKDVLNDAEQLLLEQLFCIAAAVATALNDVVTC